MGRKTIPGLIRRKGVWHLDKRIAGRRICESTGTAKLEEAEQFLTKRVHDIRQEHLFGVRPQKTFREAAMRYIETAEIKSIDEAARHIKMLDPYIGKIPIDRIAMHSLQQYIADRRYAQVKNRTINFGLKVVRRILNLAATEWYLASGMTWLSAAPKIKLLKERDSREPYPLSWDEQHWLFPDLPEHLQQMALFKVNTGTREQEVCGLRWDWEVNVPELGASVFIIPGDKVKNENDRLVVLNRIAHAIVEGMRGIHPEFVFSYKGKRVGRMNASAWRKARVRVGLPQVRVHDLKHTFGRRLRAAGVSLEDRQDLLGHKSKRITTHYSAPELQSLIEAANKVCETPGESRKSPALVVLRRKVA